MLVKRYTYQSMTEQIKTKLIERTSIKLKKYICCDINRKKKKLCIDNSVEVNVQSKFLKQISLYCFSP